MEDRVAPENESFERFSSRLLDAIARNLPAADILRLVAQRIQTRLRSPLVTSAIGQHGSLETVEAEGIPPRAWGQLDRLLQNIDDTRQPVLVPPALASLLRCPSGPTDLVWKLPVFTPERARSGAFFVFLGKENGSRLDEGLRDSLERECMLAGVVLDRQRLQEELSRQRHFDPLTGLPNRREFERHLVEAIRSALAGGHNFSMLLLNLTRFHRINEMLGYDVADRVLSEISERLFDAGRGGHVFARVAGDEFAMILPSITESDELLNISRGLLDSLSQPFDAHGVRLRVGACIGIARFPADGQTVRRLFNSCEIALADARRCHGPHISFYHSGLARQTIEGEDIENYIADALRERRFELHYQPVFAARGGLTGFEGLLRMRTRDGALIHPGAFLPAAEESGMVVHLGEWVLESAGAQIRDWASSPVGPKRVGVNISAKQLAHHNFVKSVEEILRRQKIDPALLDIELTESSVAVDMDASRLRLAQLRSLGIGVAIDDFGTGYSSLSYLHEFPLDKVKIDQSFVRRIQTDQSSLPVVDAIIRMATSLGATVVAEGVENPNQYDILVEHGCRELQGYLFSRPLSKSAASEFALGPGQRDAGWFATRNRRIIPGA